MLFAVTLYRTVQVTMAASWVCAVDSVFVAGVVFGTATLEPGKWMWRLSDRRVALCALSNIAIGCLTHLRWFALSAGHRDLTAVAVEVCIVRFSAEYVARDMQAGSYGTSSLVISPQCCGTL